MLPLAQWLLKGQGQALAFVTVCFGAGYIFWPINIIAAAGLSLITLRQGAQQSATIAALALIPTAIIGYQLGGIYMPLLLGLSTLITSETLKQTNSWSFSLLALTGSAFAASAAMLVFFNTALLEQVSIMQEFLAHVSEQMDSQNEAQLEMMQLINESLNARFIAGIWGSMLVIMVFFGLALARSWQAQLFNPGGFQQEFHQLRLGKADTLIYIVTGLGLLAIDTSLMTWAWMSFFPLTISAVALCHWGAKQRGLGQHWYIIFYMMLIISDFVRLFLVVIALLDTSVNFRQRIKQSQIHK
ncbi:MAG: DUF2232 domain-containing protein [Sinobacterium sp.]|nr:DUF2232 domain-containing protein [Sinobacterium sp.]